ncbi:hypothetical protein [Mesorhizobium sp. M0006]
MNSGTVTEAYAQNAIRITKQIEMEQKVHDHAVREGAVGHG